MHYQLLIIGNGPDAIEAATSAAGQGRRVAWVDDQTNGQNNVTIEVLREAADRVIEGGTMTMPALRDEVARIERCQQSADRAELACLGVDVYAGRVRFLNATKIEIGNDGLTVTADSIVLACGTKSGERGHLPVNGRTVIDVESFLKLDALPQSILVVGAGRSGLDYAILLARLGIQVTVVDELSSPMELCGNLMTDTRLFDAQSLNVAFRLGDEVIGVQTRADGQVAARLASGKILTSEVILVCTGRVGRTEGLDLEAAGVGLDELGKVWCDAAGQTWAPTIRAIGDVVGFRSTKNMAG